MNPGLVLLLESDIDPDQPVVGGVQKCGCRVPGRWPEDTTFYHLQASGGEYIVDAKVSRAIVRKIGSVVCRAAAVVCIHARITKSNCSLAGRDLPRVNAPLAKQLPDRPGNRVPIQWIGVHVAGNDEMLATCKSPPLAPVIDQVVTS